MEYGVSVENRHNREPYMRGANQINFSSKLQTCGTYIQHHLDVNMNVMRFNATKIAYCIASHHMSSYYRTDIRWFVPGFELPMDTER